MPDGKGICEFSGFKVPSRELVRNWNGLMVWRRFVDRRNPQDFVRGRHDDQTLEVNRPEPSDTFLSTNEVKADDL